MYGAGTGPHRVSTAGARVAAQRRVPCKAWACAAPADDALDARTAAGHSLWELLACVSAALIRLLTLRCPALCGNTGNPDPDQRHLLQGPLAAPVQEVRGPGRVMLGAQQRCLHALHDCTCPQLHAGSRPSGTLRHDGSAARAPAHARQACFQAGRPSRVPSQPPPPPFPFPLHPTTGPPPTLWTSFRCSTALPPTRCRPCSRPSRAPPRCRWAVCQPAPTWPAGPTCTRSACRCPMSGSACHTAGRQQCLAG